ncbi:MAG: redoxin family protein [Chloroflexota bacterium]
MDALIEIGAPAPDLSLPDLVGRPHRLSNFRRRVVLINFWSSECPHVARVDIELSRLFAVWGDQVVWVSIAANANESIDALRQAAAERCLPLVLLDRNQKAVELYGAVTTPHFFVLDQDGILRYQGAFDDVTFRQRTATRLYLQEAIEAVLAGRQPEPAQVPPYGCTIVRL